MPLMSRIAMLGVVAVAMLLPRLQCVPCEGPGAGSGVDGAGCCGADGAGGCCDSETGGCCSGSEGGTANAATDRGCCDSGRAGVLCGWAQWCPGSGPGDSRGCRCVLDDGPVVLVMQRLALQRAAQHGVVPVWAGEPTTPVLAELGRFAACTADARPPPMSSRMRRAVLCIRTI